MKARRGADAKKFEDIPNVGPRIARDFVTLGFRAPQDLIGKDPFKLYTALSKKTGVRQDPCVLDTFMAVTDFMNGGIPKEWWRYTNMRKQQYPKV